MMSAQRDWRRRLPALTYPAISAGTAAPLLGRHVEAPLFLVLRYLTGILLGFLRGRTTFWLCTGRRLCRANLVRGLTGSLCGSRDS
jgi:hypothetical protein